MTEKNSNGIYVSDWGTKTITRLSEELQVLQSFTDAALRGPRSLATVGGGQLLLADSERDSKLYVLDVTTGQFDELLGQSDNLNSTWCVAVSHRLDTVYVTDWYLGVGDNLAKFIVH